jgi:hypothetical protein
VIYFRCYRCLILMGNFPLGIRTCNGRHSNYNGKLDGRTRSKTLLLSLLSQLALCRKAKEHGRLHLFAKKSEFTDERKRNADSDQRGRPSERERERALKDFSCLFNKRHNNFNLPRFLSIHTQVPRSSSELNA